MKGIRAGLLLLGLVGGGPEASAQAERPAVIVTDPRARAFRIAVQEFASSQGDVDPGRFRGELIGALEFSSVFSSLDPAAFLGPPATRELGDALPACADWSPIGADVLLEGILTHEGDSFVAEFRATDVVRCRAVLRKRYRGSGSEARDIARRIADDIVGAFTGTPGVASTEITFISDRSGNPEVYVMDADGSNARAATRDRALKGFPDWAPDGSSILYMSYQYQRAPHLFRIVRSGGLPAGRVLRNLEAGQSVYRGVYSPDGESIAAVVTVDGVADIFRVDADGRNLRRLTRSPAIDVSPTWSPDGRQIAFVSDRTGSPQLYVMDAQGERARRLTFDGGYNAAPAWSPDGRWIAYEARLQGQFDIWLIDPQGQVNTPVIDHPRSDENPAWSPDSRKIAFHSTRRGNSDIYVVDLDGNNLRRLTQGRGASKQPNWGPFPR